jgi:5,5'-dehydrodivanillate O-demethylase
MTTKNGDARSDRAIAEYTDFARTGPGALAGRYMRSFWQPVCVAEKLAPGMALPIRIMSEDFTLYRGENGVPHLVDFRCAHRGSQLSIGYVEGDCIRCLYHGWMYDATGQCVEQPGEDQDFARKVQISGYPTCEYLGLIFGYFGKGAAPPLPRYPELEAEGVLAVDSCTWRCNYFQMIENYVDQVHVHFAHPDALPPQQWRDIPKISAEETDFGMCQFGTYSDGHTWRAQYIMPNVRSIIISPVYGPSSDFSDRITWRVPIDDESHECFTMDLIPVTGEAACNVQAYLKQRRTRLAALPPASELAAGILAGRLRLCDVAHRLDQIDTAVIQDMVAQVGQGAIVDRGHERLGRADVAIILLRKIWARELQALAEGRSLKQWSHKTLSRH